MSTENDKAFKILSIDGGGIKGLYSATILKKFEEKFNTLTTNHFDMICGTSTGGLIAIAASLGISAKEICDFYITEGVNIFPKQKIKVPIYGNIDKGFLKQVVKGGKYTDIGLKNALLGVFGDKKIKDCNNLLCIPSYSITEAKPIVFKYDHSEGELSRDNNAPLVDVALATTAAPTYFPIAESTYYKNEQFIDGGVWANNPAMVGLLEALDHFVGIGKQYNSIEILSISSLSITGGKPPSIKRERSFIDWREELFETSLNGQSYFANYFLSKVTKFAEVKIKYLRIPSFEVSREQEHLIQLDIATEDAYKLMKIKGEKQALIFEKQENIKEFFTTLKTYNLR